MTIINSVIFILSLHVNCLSIIVFWFCSIGVLLDCVLLKANNNNENNNREPHQVAENNI